MVIKVKRRKIKLNQGERVVMLVLEKKIDEELRKNLEALQLGEVLRVDIVSPDRYSRDYTGFVDYALREKYQRAGWTINKELEHNHSRGCPTDMQTVFIFSITPHYR